MASLGWEHGLSFLSGLKDLWPVVCSFQNLNNMDDIVSQTGMWLLAVTASQLLENNQVLWNQYENMCPLCI